MPSPLEPKGGAVDAADAPLIELRSVSRVYGEGAAEVHALRSASLTIRRGELVAIVGASGSGKSTCMNVIGGLDRPTSGEFLFQGVDVASLDSTQRALYRRHYVGFVFQGFNLLARTSAVENVELPLVYRRVPPRERRAKAMEALASVGLEGRELHTPSELSGGQQQRVAIARALATMPSLLLADEPTGNLDSAKKAEIMALLSSLNRDRGLTVVIVTHEPDVARWARRIVEFKDGSVARDEANVPAGRAR